MSDSASDQRLDAELRRFLAWQSGDLARAPSTGEMVDRVAAQVLRRQRPMVRGLVPVLLLLGLLISLVGTGILLLGRPTPPIVVPPMELRTFTYAADGYELALPEAWMEQDNAEYRTFARWQGVRTFQAALSPENPRRLLYISFGDTDGRVGLPVEVVGVTGVITAEIKDPVVDSIFMRSLEVYRLIDAEDLTLGGQAARVIFAEAQTNLERAYYVIAVHEGRPLILRFLAVGYFADRDNLNRVLATFRFLK